MALKTRTALRVAVLVAALVPAGCGRKAPTPTTAADRAPPAAPPGTAIAADAKPDFTFDAETWHTEWKKDRDAAKKKYAGKLIELAGEVSFVHVEWDGLDSGPGGMVNLKDEKIGPVTCITTDPQPWLMVSQGSKVRILGRSGKRDAEELADCRIVEAGPNPALTVTAEEIASAVAADRDDAAKKYDKKCAHITGTVGEVVKDKDGTAKLKLKTTGVEVNAGMGRPTLHRSGPIEAGQPIKLFAEIWIPADSKGEVTLIWCVVTRELAK